MGRFKKVIWSAKKRKSVKWTTDSANKFDNDKKRLLADSDKRSWYDRTNLLEGNIEEPFSVKTDEESYCNEETGEIHWVKQSASLFRRPAYLRIKHASCCNMYAPLLFHLPQHIL